MQLNIVFVIVCFLFYETKFFSETPFFQVFFKLCVISPFFRKEEIEIIVLRRTSSDEKLSFFSIYLGNNYLYLYIYFSKKNKPKRKSQTHKLSAFNILEYFLC